MLYVNLKKNFEVYSHNSHYPLLGGRQFTPRHFIPAKHNDKTTILILKIIEY